MINVTCPDCEKDFDYDETDDSPEDGNIIRIECEHCEKTFRATLHITVDLTDVTKCPCLNDEAEHVWRPLYWLNDRRVIVRCGVCREVKGVPLKDAKKYGYTDKDLEPIFL